MVALSFLGVGKYEETLYSYNGTSIKTNLFPYAFYEFVKPEKFFVIMTQKAKKTHAAELSDKCDYEEILIPDGKSETEIWEMFEKIKDRINPKEEVVFDITHGFRSQPIIVIALLLYLRALKDVKIENILYGAFEAKDENNAAPVFELKSFIDLIDWSNAVHEFIKNGNMKYLNGLLTNIHKNSYINKMPNPSKQLQGAGSDLEKLTDAFATIRLDEIFEHSFKFSNRIKQLTEDLNNNFQAKPFSDLINIIYEKFKPISDAEKDKFSKKGFEAQKSILNWYLETGKFQKAITLAREYIVSKYLVEILNKDESCLLEKAIRGEAEDGLNASFQRFKNKSDMKPREKEFAQIWGEITNIRNDINHAGMRKEVTSSKRIIKNTERIVNEINSKF